LRKNKKQKYNSLFSKRTKTSKKNIFEIWTENIKQENQRQHKFIQVVDCAKSKQIGEFGLIKEKITAILLIESRERQIKRIKTFWSISQESKAGTINRGNNQNQTAKRWSSIYLQFEIDDNVVSSWQVRKKRKRKRGRRDKSKSKNWNADSKSALGKSLCLLCSSKAHDFHKNHKKAHNWR
jgi:hypothetical protein